MKDLRVSLTVLVPVYNEIQTVEKILDTLVESLAGINHEVIIVDDHSKDGTREFLQRWHADNSQRLPHYRLILHEFNRGKGGAIQTGLAVASGRYFVVQDADLEYNPSDILPLLRTAEASGFEAVYGSRFLGQIKNMPRANYIANRFYNIFLRVLYPTNVTDMHTCYKMVRTDILRSLDMRSEGFEYATEMISKLLRRGVLVQELPISFNGRTVKEGKKIGIGDGIDCVVKMIGYRVMPNSKLSRNTVEEHADATQRI